MPLSPRAFGYIFALLATLLWSGNFITARVVAPCFSPLITSFFRSFVAFIIAVYIGWPYLRKEWPVMRKHLGYCFTLSIVGVTLNQIFVYTAGQTSAVLNMTLIAAIAPVTIALAARIILGDPITKRQGLGMLIAIIGTAFLITHGDITLLYHMEFTVGDLWILGSACFFGVYSALLRKKPEGISGMGLLSLLFIISFISNIPLGLWDIATGGKLHFTMASIAGVLYVGIFSSIVAYIFWNKAVDRIGPSQSAFVYYSLPIFSAFEGYIMLGESISVEQIASGALILTGSLIAMKKHKALAS